MTTAMDAVDIAGGIAVPNFFNGRILSAEDLRLVLHADRRHRALLGRALGPGIAAGLRVAPAVGAPGVLQVTSGAAVNRNGETIDLPDNLLVRVAGSGAVSSAAAASGPVFADCGGSSPTSTTSNAFLLTIQPDSLETGSAPADVYLTGQPCGPGFVAEGVRFRRVPVDPTAIAASLGVVGVAGLGSASPYSRNVVSHLFLGSAPWTDFGDVATAPGIEPDLERAHLLAGLQRCEVPLALLYLQGNAVAQVDEWAVRRPCRAATDDATGLAGFTSELRSSAGAATYLQFEAQLAELLGSGTPPRLGPHFRYLPAAGILPSACIGAPPTVADFLGAPTLPFFAAVSTAAWSRAERPVRSARVESIVRDGTRLPPVDLLTTRGLPVTVAVVQESLAAGEPYAVFVAAQHPYQERIDLDELTDRVAVLEPPADEAPQLTVVKQDHQLLYREDGYRLVVRYRVVTNTPDRYQLTPFAQKPVTSAVTVTSYLHGEEQRFLPDGVTIVSVDHALRLLGNDFYSPVLLNPYVESPKTTRSAFRAAGAAPAPEPITRVRRVAEEAVRHHVADHLAGGLGGVVGDKAFDDHQLHIKQRLYTFGLDVVSIADASIAGRAAFTFEGP